MSRLFLQDKWDYTEEIVEADWNTENKDDVFSKITTNVKPKPKLTLSHTLSSHAPPW